MVNFTPSEKRVIRAMHQLNRWATTNEIAEWAEKMSWNTANKVLKRLHSLKVVDKKVQKKRKYWKLRY